jgi:integrator complex subunit 11
MLVHGEAQKMEFLRAKIRSEHGIDCFMPANGETAHIPTPTVLNADVQIKVVKEEAKR